MRRLGKWLLPALGLGQLLLLRSGVLTGRDALVVAGALEAIVLLVAGRQVLLALRAYHRQRAAGFDFWAALEDGLALLMPRSVARLAVLEPKLWYCLGRWLLRRRAEVNDFPYQRRALIGPILLLAIITMPAELLAFELLIPWQWLRVVLAVASLYSLFWLAGFYASLRVLPHQLEPASLRVRFCAFAEGVVPYSSITAIVVERRATPGGRDGLQLAPRQPVAYLGTGGRTDLTLRLDPPLALRGLRGPTAPVTLLCLAADEPERLSRELAGRTGQAVVVTGAPARARDHGFWRIARAARKSYSS